MTTSAVDVSNELNFTKKIMSHATYKYVRKGPQSGSNSVTVSTGGDQIIFQCPTEPVNYAKSFLRFDVELGASTTINKANALHAATVPYFSQVSFYGDNTKYILDNMHNDVYLRSVGWAETPLNEYLTNDLCASATTAGGVSTVYNGLRRNNAVTLTLPEAKRPVVANAGGAAADAQLYNTEPSYCISGAGPGGGAVATVSYLEVMIPLSKLCPGTFFDLDKDSYFGSEIMNIRLITQSKSKIAFLYDSGANYGSNPIDAEGALTLSNFSVHFAVEQNREIKEGLRNKIMSPSGLDILIPYVNPTKRQIGGSNQSMSLTYKRSHGSHLKRVYHTITASGETKNNAYNINQLANIKILQYYTLLNGNVKLQDNNLVTQDLDDWMYMKEKLKGSVLGQSSNVYKYNWVHCDDFGCANKPLIEHKNDINDGMISGLPLDSNDATWDFVSVNNVNEDLNHYTFGVTLRRLNISASGYNIV